MAFKDFIGAIASPVTSIVNGLLQSSENKKNREFAREMYNQQLIDNINLWHMQNAYNDPSQQMQRIYMAGLNPALMYQQGNTGVSPSAPHSAEYKPFNTPAPQVEKLDILGQYYSVQNMRLQNEKIEQEISESKTRERLNTAKTDNVIVNTKQITDNKEWLDLMAQSKAMTAEADSRLFQHRTHVLVDLHYKVDAEGNPVTDENGNMIPSDDNYKDANGRAISAFEFNFTTEVNKGVEELNNLVERTNLTKQQIVTELCKPNVMAAQIDYLVSHAGLAREQAANLTRMYNLALAGYQLDVDRLQLDREIFEFRQEVGDTVPGALTRALRFIFHNGPGSGSGSGSSVSSGGDFQIGVENKY